MLRGTEGGDGCEHRGAAGHAGVDPTRGVRDGFESHPPIQAAKAVIRDSSFDFFPGLAGVTVFNSRPIR
jgi:hypothetical protein